MNKIIDKILIFSKAQLSAFTGGVVDYAVMVSLTELFCIHYTITTVIGGIVGAFVNFSLNKYWTFPSKEKPYSNTMYKQVIKFILVALNSILLKSSGTFFVTMYLELDYKVSRIVVDLFVSLMFNYNLQRCWVFKKVK